MKILNIKHEIMKWS